MFLFIILGSRESIGKEDRLETGGGVVLSEDTVLILRIGVPFLYPPKQIQ